MEHEIFHYSDLLKVSNSLKLKKTVIKSFIFKSQRACVVNGKGPLPGTDEVLGQADAGWGASNGDMTHC